MHIWNSIGVQTVEMKSWLRKGLDQSTRRQKAKKSQKNYVFVF